LNSATQDAIGYALAMSLDTTQGDRDDMFKLTSKEVFSACREKFCGINGAPIGHLVNENLRNHYCHYFHYFTVIFNVIFTNLFDN
jgi:hypothetical protein